MLFIAFHLQENKHAHRPPVDRLSWGWGGRREKSATYGPIYGGVLPSELGRPSGGGGGGVGLPGGNLPSEGSAF